MRSKFDFWPTFYFIVTVQNKHDFLRIQMCNTWYTSVAQVNRNFVRSGTYLHLNLANRKNWKITQWSQFQLILRREIESNPYTVAYRESDTRIGCSFMCFSNCTSVMIFNVYVISCTWSSVKLWYLSPAHVSCVCVVPYYFGCRQWCHWKSGGSIFYVCVRWNVLIILVTCGVNIRGNLYRGVIFKM